MRPAADADCWILAFHCFYAGLDRPPEGFDERFVVQSWKLPPSYRSAFEPLETFGDDLARVRLDDLHPRANALCPSRACDGGRVRAGRNLLSIFELEMEICAIEEDVGEVNFVLQLLKPLHGVSHDQAIGEGRGLTKSFLIGNFLFLP